MAGFQLWVNLPAKFKMTTREEIEQALRDLRDGTFVQ
jgi:redox-sensitive bicupin YhaK (pirin superfamily)